MRKRSIRIGLVMLAGALLVFGTAAYMISEGLSLFDAFYLLIITVTTVGYGDIYPTTAAGRMLTLLVVPVGLLIVFGLGITYIADRMDDLVLRGGVGRMEKKVRSLKNHVIVCGYDSLGQEVVRNLRRRGGPVVVVDQDLDRLRGLEDEGVYYIVGNALEEETLVRAGILQARCIIATFSDDTSNVYLVLEARGIHPDVEVISSASGREARRRLYLAGASRVVSPQLLGGDILAKSAHSPYIYQLMSDMMSDDATDETISQIVVDPGSPLEGRCLRDFRQMGINARVMLMRGEDATVLSPTGEVELKPNMVLVVVGTVEELDRLDEMSSVRSD